MDILSRLHALPLSRFHFRLLGLIGLGWLFDAMDTGMVSFVLVTLASEWQLDAQQSGWIVSVGFIGMALGAVLSGWAADRFGRRNVFAATMVLYGAATGLCALAPNLPFLLICRFWVGFGLGGQLPVAVSLVSEYAPPRLRGRFIVLLESFWGLGWLAAALVSYYLIPHYGWRSAFFAGAVPLFYAFAVWKRLPESVAYLLAANRLDEAHTLLCRLESQAGLTPAATAIAPSAPAKTRNRLIELCQTHADAVADLVWHRFFLLRYFHLAAQTAGGTRLCRGENFPLRAGDDSCATARLLRRCRAGGNYRTQGNARWFSRRLRALCLLLRAQHEYKRHHALGQPDVLL